MNLIIIKEKLKNGLDAVARIAGGNTNLPILKNVLLETQENKLVLTTTNLEIAIRYSVLGKVIERGSLTVPAIVFSQLINSLESERINLDTHIQHTLSLTTDNYQASLQSMPPDDFPLIPKVKDDNCSIEIDQGILRDALNTVIVGTQFSELRQELNNILFSYNEQSLVIVGTDSFRLAEKTVYKQHIINHGMKEINLLIPLKTIHELLRLLKEKETIHISCDEHQVKFMTDNFELISRISQGAFPDYKAIIPKKFDTELVVERKEVLRAMKLTAVFGSRSSEILLRVVPDQKIIEITSRDEELGENVYRIPAKIQGTALEAHFNWKYIIDGIKEGTHEELLITLNAENAPAMIKLVGDTSYFYLLMPILKS